MRLTIDIDIPDDQVAEFAAQVARHLAAEIGQVPAARPESAGSGPPAPRTGRELYLWAKAHDRVGAAARIAKRLKFGHELVALSEDQARQVWAEIASGKPPKGSQAWGGQVARVGHAGDK